MEEFVETFPYPVLLGTYVLKQRRMSSFPVLSPLLSHHLTQSSLKYIWIDGITFWDQIGCWRKVLQREDGRKNLFLGENFLGEFACLFFIDNSITLYELMAEYDSEWFKHNARVNFTGDLVTSTPDVFQVALGPEVEFLLLASDGLSDYMNRFFLFWVWHS